MSMYTTQVRYICESAIGLDESKGFNDVNRIIEESIPYVFNFEFPIFDENYRPVLCKKILKHYYTREIGLETVGLWKLKLDTKLNEIMPYYNKLYMSELLDLDLTANVNLKRTKKVENENIQSNTYEKTLEGSGSLNVTDDTTNTTSGSETVERENQDLYSDTPQGTIIDVEDAKYLTDVRIVKDGAESESDSRTTNLHDRTEITNVNSEDSYTGNITANNVEDYLEMLTGSDGRFSNAQLLEDFRKTFLNIDVMIINDLSDLFFKLW